MEATNSFNKPSAVPDNLGQLRAMVQGRDDDTIYEGVRPLGVEAVLALLGLTILPGAVAPEGGGAQGTVQFVLATADGEHHLWISRGGAAVESGVGSADRAQATVAMKFTDLLRLLSNESGKDVAAQLATKSMRVTGDEALVRALPGWFRLPG